MWEPVGIWTGLEAASFRFRWAVARFVENVGRRIESAIVVTSATAQQRGHRSGPRHGRTGSVVYLVRETGREGGLVEPFARVLGPSRRWRRRVSM